MKLRFIFNPHSGRHRRSARLRPLLQDFIAAHALNAELVDTRSPGHATELAREAVADGCARVISVGGDGTLNEVAQALLHTPVALALVPCGSGNGLALHLGLPTSPLEALDLAVGGLGRVAEVDTGSVNGRPFFNAMGAGLDAEVGRRFNLLEGRGLTNYARTALAAFRARRMERCLIAVGNEPPEPIDTLLIAVANSDQYGNRALIAAGARVDDGALDLVAVRPVGFLGAAALAARLFLGSLDRSPRVRRLRGARFVIDRPAPGLIHTDGETHFESARIEVRVHPRSLRIVVPVGCRAVMATEESERHGFVLQLP